MNEIKDIFITIIMVIATITLVGFLLYGMLQVDKACQNGDKEACATIDIIEMMD